MKRLLVCFVITLIAFATALRGGQAPSVKANRVILRVTDLKASVAFYRDRVGLPLQSTFDEFAVFGGDGLLNWEVRTEK